MAPKHMTTTVHILETRVDIPLPPYPCGSSHCQPASTESRYTPIAAAPRMISVVPELRVEPVMNRRYQPRLLGPVDNPGTELDLPVLDRKPFMPQDQLVEPGHVLAVNHRGVVEVARGKAVGLLFEMLPDD